MTPHEVRRAVPSEVIGGNNAPVGIRDRREIVAGLEACAIHEPDRVLAARAVAPQDVGVTIAIKVGGADHLPVGIGNGGQVVATL
ncbi:MAG TPA: hypothetical protein V6C98_04045 [Thermosynechococcaceae cyanobacterium]